MPEYRLEIDRHGYDPSMAFAVKDIVTSFMRRNYGGGEYKVSVDRKRGTLEFHLKNPDDVNVLTGEIRNASRLRNHRFIITDI